MQSPSNLFPSQLTIEFLNQMGAKTMSSHLGIEFTEIGADHIIAKMPVDFRTHQPLGLLHGGASVVLAETLGSIAANCCLDTTKQYAVGLEINANHVRSVSEGFVYGKTTPIHIGRSTHVWDIRITNEKDQLVCVSRLTVAIKDKK
ncbi:hotdog fold thioesterase [Cytophagaceae bacterium DM2B3-1]|uniref:Hotdog fold thioesterase n=2 Tax=Xanthocytophaga TaxID=3078918 RepID=A0ABT7CK08_9BACT|nr:MULTISPECIES: hotdog fold thioesterase [Xanthocytophaga]MDJ1469414.1 hotdog fold thioesterase [Xanthocytophaga flavus]MDJ1494074.1 hotdog fold thioesterase [Xanthocytophaga flavus]MDJ1499223.1 hotdog fold thioesterase [Xanthocytophaga agilis]